MPEPLFFSARNTDTGIFCEFCETSKNAFFTEQLRVTAFVSMSTHDNKTNYVYIMHKLTSITYSIASLLKKH